MVIEASYIGKISTDQKYSMSISNSVETCGISLDNHIFDQFDSTVHRCIDVVCSSFPWLFRLSALKGVGIFNGDLLIRVG
jgi:hypothetical protein